MNLINTLGNMSNFNFYDFLTKREYRKETVRDDKGITFCTNYQKELEENTWNAITIHKNKTFSGASPKLGLIYKEQIQPSTKEEAEEILKQLETF